MTISQFLSILERNSLRFTRSDNFDDPYEGELPKKNKKQLSQDEELQLPSDWTVLRRGNRFGSMWEWTNKRSLVEANRRITFINCWHQKEGEQDPLWRANLNGADGVVVKSDVNSLETALSVYPFEVYIGEVEYIDFEEDKISKENDNDLLPFMYKRRGFKEENEIRAVVTELPSDRHPGYEGLVGGETLPLNWSEQADGLYVNVDVDDLIDEVRISPTSGSWIAETLSEVVSKYDYSFNVNNSSLSIS